MSQTEQLLTIFTAYDPKVLRAAFKGWALWQKKSRDGGQGWVLFEGAEIPERHEWFEINGKRFIRPIPDRIVTSSAPAPQPKPEPIPQPESEPGPDSLSCPVCGEQAYPQPVCPNCAKGKGGMKTQWICGNDSNHFFYTEY